MSGSDEQRLFEEARFGIEVESFLESPIGRYLKSRILTEEDEAKAALIEVDPEDVKAIREIQNGYQVVRKINLWLAEAVQAGYQAEMLIKQTEV